MQQTGKLVILGDPEAIDKAVAAREALRGEVERISTEDPYPAARQVALSVLEDL